MDYALDPWKRSRIPVRNNSSTRCRVDVNRRVISRWDAWNTGSAESKSQTQNIAGNAENKPRAQNITGNTESESRTQNIAGSVGNEFGALVAIVTPPQEMGILRNGALGVSNVRNTTYPLQLWQFGIGAAAFCPCDSLKKKPVSLKWKYICMYIVVNQGIVGNVGILQLSSDFKLY